MASGYTEKQWKRLAEWVAQHIDLIKQTKPELVVLIASKSSDSITAAEREAGWAPAPGIRPSHDEIAEAIHLAHLWGWIDAEVGGFVRAPLH